MRATIRRHPFGGGGASGVTSFNGQTGAVLFPLQSRDFFADQLDVPLTADFAVTGVASRARQDGIPIAEFDDTVEQGVVLPDHVPDAASHGVDPTRLTFDFLTRAASAPGAAATCGLKVYWREIPDNAALGAWSSLVLDDVDIPTNTNYQYDSQTLTIGAGVGEIDLTPGRSYQFEVTRVAPSAGTNLTGDLYLARIRATYSVV